MIKKTTLAAATSAALLAGGLAAPAAQAGWSGNIGATSNYVWRGATQTGNGAAIQGGIDYESDGGFYVGAWASNVDFKDGVGGTSNGQYELDGYFGWSGAFADDNVGLDVGYVYYHYGLTPEADADFGELYGTLNLWGLDIGAAYTTNDKGNKADDDMGGFVRGDLYYFVGYSYDLSEDWSLGATVGQYRFTNDGEPLAGDLNYTHWQIDATRGAGDFGDFTLSVSRATNENADGNDNVKVFVSWTKGF